MKLTIASKELLRAIARVQPAAERKSGAIALECVLITASGDGVTFAATDLYQSITTRAQAAVGEPGAAALSAKTLLGIARQLTGDVTIDVGADHGAVIKSGKTRFKLPGQPARDMPVIADSGDATFIDIAAADLARMIALTHYAMSSESARDHLTGTLFDVSGGVLRVVATDGKRMSKGELPVSMPDQRFVVPGKGVLELKRLADDAGDGVIGVAVKAAAGMVFFMHGADVMTSRLVDDAFPPWTRFIPESSEARVTLDRAQFIAALKRMSLTVDEKAGNVVRVDVSAGVMRIGSENSSVGEGVDELDVDYAGKEACAGFNARYMLDALTAMSDDVVSFEFGTKTAHAPGALRPISGAEGFVGIVMPIRLAAL